MANHEPRRLLIDTDVGTDDAVALLLAMRHPGVGIEAITTVAGNIDVDQCARNARYVSELCDWEVPVYRGAATPLVRPTRQRAAVHGDDGLGGLGLRPRHPDPDTGIAAEALVELIRRNPGEFILVTLGPLTNLALALSLAPGIAGQVQHVIMMAGAATGPGTVTPRCEFNVWSDPEAARIVFQSGMPLTMVGVELSRGACAIGAAEQQRLAEVRAPRAGFAVAMLRASADGARPGLPSGSAGVPDAIAMAVALQPHIVTRSARYHVDVETAGELTAGETVVDHLALLGLPPNVEVVEAVDSAHYKRMIFDACR